MGDLTRWRKWKPSGIGLPKPAEQQIEGGFVSSVSFVSSPEKQSAAQAAKPPEIGSSPQVIENKEASVGDEADRLKQDSARGGFVSFVSSVSRDTSKNTRTAPCLMSWAEWKAGSLNRLIREQGTSGRPGRITAATVRDGEQREKEQL
jgi:hypothetical protein